MDKNIKINIVISHFIEILVLNVILSVIVAILASFSIIEKQWVMIAVLTVALVVFNVVNIGKCRWSYAHLKEEKDYYIINIAAYLMFALVNIICIYILPNWAYTWVFLTTKLERFILLGVIPGDSFWNGLLFSSIVFHLVGIAAILCAPFGLDWVSDYEAPEDLKMLETEDAKKDKEKEV